MAATHHVAIEELAKEYLDHRGQPFQALASIDLRVGWGEFVAIIGPSGCGKSTLLRLVGGLLAPSAGRVLIAGRDPRQAQRRKEVGFVFQDPALLPWRSVLGNVRLPLEVNRNHRPALRAGEGAAPSPQELLALVGLAAFSGYYPHQLSGGMQQRAAIARALVFDPGLLLMDEPFGALDEITRAAMRYELLRIWQARPTGRPSCGLDLSAPTFGPGKTVLFVTHSIAEAVVLADRVVVLSASPGRVRAVIPIELPRPRREEVERQPAFLAYAAQLRGLLKE